MQGFGGIAAWMVILCIVGAIAVGPALRGCAAGLNSATAVMECVTGGPCGEK